MAVERCVEGVSCLPAGQKSPWPMPSPTSVATHFDFSSPSSPSSIGTGIKGFDVSSPTPTGTGTKGCEEDGVKEDGSSESLGLERLYDVGNCASPTQKSPTNAYKSINDDDDDDDDDNLDRINDNNSNNNNNNNNNTTATATNTLDPTVHRVYHQLQHQDDQPTPPLLDLSPLSLFHKSYGGVGGTGAGCGQGTGLGPSPDISTVSGQLPTVTTSTALLPQVGRCLLGLQSSMLICY